MRSHTPEDENRRKLLNALIDEMIKFDEIAKFINESGGSWYVVKKLEGIKMENKLGFYFRDKHNIKWKKEISIHWKLDGVSGNGLWHPENFREEFQRNVDELCEKFGIGTHWIEERDM